MRTCYVHQVVVSWSSRRSQRPRFLIHEYYNDRQELLCVLEHYRILVQRILNVVDIYDMYWTSIIVATTLC